MKNRKLDFKYTAIQGIYCMLICIIVGYASVYLIDKGFSNAIIGIILSLGNVLAVIMQQVLAKLHNSIRYFTLKKINMGLIVGLIIAAGMLLLFDTHQVVLPVIVVIAIMLINTLQPFINSLVFAYEKVNIAINFGLARGVGSFSYAGTSLVLGNVLSQVDTNIIPFLYVGISILLFLLLSWFEVPQEEITEVEEITEEKRSFISFIKEYKIFLLMLLATLLLFYDQNIINSFFIQIINNVNGNSSHLGNAMFLAAAVELPTMLFYKKINQRFSCQQLMVFSAIFFSIKHVLTYLAPSITINYVAQLLQAFAFAIFLPTSVYIVRDIVKEKDLVLGQTLFTGTMTLGSVFASFTGGILLDSLGVSHTLLIGAIVSVIGTLVMIGTIRKSKS